MTLVPLVCVCVNSENAHTKKRASAANCTSQSEDNKLHQASWNPAAVEDETVCAILFVGVATTCTIPRLAAQATPKGVSSLHGDVQPLMISRSLR